MTFIEALQIITEKIKSIDPSFEVDQISLHAIFEDIVLEQAAEMLDEDTIDSLAEMDSRLDIEKVLQKKVPDYDKLLEKSIDQAMSEREDDSIE